MTPRAMSEPPSLLTLVGRMKVRALAELVGMSVEELAAAVLREPRSQAPADTTPPVAVMWPSSPRVTEPSLAAMLGHATYRQIRVAVDHWLFTRAFEEFGSVLGVARRLGLSRKTVRQRWARVRGLDHEERLTTRGRPIPAPPPPSLTEIFDRGGKYAAIRDALELWMLGAVLVEADDNMSQAAWMLAMPRTAFRKRWARVAPGHDGGA